MAIAKTVPHALETFSRLPGHLIRRVHQASTAIFAEECGTELTAVQYAALAAIRSHPRIDATRLAQAIYFDRSTIGDVLDRLEAKGWVRRHATAHDRRIKRLTLSPAGREVLRQAEPGVLRVQERLLAPLPRKDASTFLRLLIKMAEAHNEGVTDGR
jgi:DNA-binding MarR family transcriptional regulator